MSRRYPPHEPDQDCTCPPNEINPECWLHGDPEPPEPDCICPDEPTPGGVYPASWRTEQPDCPVHGNPEPPEPDHRQLRLELEQPMWEGNLPEGF